MDSSSSEKPHAAVVGSVNHHHEDHHHRPVARRRSLSEMALQRVKTMSKSAHLDPTHFWSSIVAGVGSGAVSSVLCAPLDLVRTRMQVWGDVKGNTAQASAIPGLVREIIAQDGLRGLFRGLGVTLVTVPFFWGVYFPFYEDFKLYYTHTYPNTRPTLIHMGSAVTAGAVADVLCNPMFVVRTRLQTEALHQQSAGKRVKLSIMQTARALYREGGPLIFWRGMSANLMGLSHVAVQFPIYEYLKKRFRKNRTQESVTDLLAASSLSKMMACVTTYPHEVLRSRLMDSRKRLRLTTVAKRIYHTEGMAGFYAGLPVTLIRVLPYTCVTFMAYELILRWTRKRIGEQNEKRR